MKWRYKNLMVGIGSMNEDFLNETVILLRNGDNSSTPLYRITKDPETFKYIFKNFRSAIEIIEQ
ncbi:hypothetical protein Glove_139g395 [Diversispora epigaea]|uniref:Uncharacterized protein n=1 Tax=Diversispora epigaea TaxID=1348612 RepID=A0A397IVF6_9GLOM|nr:hypothetical protein Glove_139g395 [Diversispora epigaea]